MTLPLAEPGHVAQLAGALSHGARLAGALSHVAHGVPSTPSPGSATASPANAAVQTAPTVSAGHLLFQLVLGLGVVLAIVLGAKRLLHGRGSSLAGLGASRRSPIRVLGRHSLGKGVSVAVVQFGDDAYLVGVTPTSVRRLARTEAARLAAAEDEAPTGSRRVDPSATTLGRALGRISPALAAHLAPSPAGDGRPTPGRRTLPARAGTDAAVLDLVPVIRSSEPTSAGDGTARAATPRGARPAPTWTSAIEHLRERTVRRA